MVKGDQILSEAGLKEVSAWRHLGPKGGLNHNLQVEWLAEACLDGSETEAEWKEFRDTLWSKDPFRLWNGHIALFSRALTFGLQVDPGKVALANPLLVQAWLEGFAGEATPRT